MECIIHYRQKFKLPLEATFTLVYEFEHIFTQKFYP